MWKQLVIDGTIFHYAISDKGEVRNTNTGLTLKNQHTRDGYCALKISNPDIRFAKTMRVHRLVAMMYLPNPNNWPEVNHKDGNKDNNRVDNLEWCTSSYNQKHAYATGLKHCVIKHGCGEDCYGSKYTEKQIREVCVLLQEGKLTYRQIAERTGVSRRNVVTIRCKQSWHHITKDYKFKEKMSNHAMFHKSVDKAILSGVPRENIIGALAMHMDEKQAKGVYDYRIKMIKIHRSPLQCDVYIDNGRDIFDY